MATEHSRVPVLGCEDKATRSVPPCNERACEPSLLFQFVNVLLHLPMRIGNALLLLYYCYLLKIHGDQALHTGVLYNYNVVLVPHAKRQEC